MSELGLTFLRLGYLVLLWVLIFVALGILRHDLFGVVVTPRGRGRSGSRNKEPRAQRRKREKTKPVPTRLIISEGPLAGTTMPLGSTAIIVGRSPACTLVLNDDYASAQHARFYPADGGWVVEDLGSTNGTVVNGERISTPIALTAELPVRIGQTVIELGA